MNIKNLIILVLVVALVAVTLYPILFSKQCQQCQQCEPNKVESSVVGNRVITYLNTYFTKNTTTTLESITEENGLYHLKINITGQSFDTYATIDGNMLFPSALDMNKQPVM